MSIVRIGSNDKYASGWSLAFSRGKKSAAAGAAKKASPKKKTAKKAKKK